MARLGRLTALAALTLLTAPLERAFAVETGAPVAVAARLTQDQGGAKLVFDLSRTVEASASALTVARAHCHRHAGGQLPP